MNDNDENPETPASGGAEAAGAPEALIADLKDRLLRALADTENLRRRAEREKQEANLYAVTRFARDMLGIADNFARALAACPPEKLEAADPQIKAVIEGVEATERQLLSTLERYGVRKIETEGARFDPNLHQAIAEVPGDGKPQGTIVNVVQTGYVIGDRLLRPAMVTVAGAPPPPAPEPGGAVDTTA
ncbi:MAG TPA: nucleotide exchange factor GrpE [Rhizomicrobium sp.]|nr:nucleotide exchange factor GrpE [Rhizomicrobium sp.]